MLAYVLTLGRCVLAAGFAVVVAFYPDAPLAAGPALVLLATALAAECTDMLDGWAARRAGTDSELGGLLDPLCDSLSRLTMYFAASLAGWVWIAVPLVMTARDIVVAYVRIIVGRAGGKTSARLSGKVKAVTQGLAVLALVALASQWAAPANPADPAAGATADLLRGLVTAAVIGVTLWSLADYVRGGWPAVKRMYRDR